MSTDTLEAGPAVDTAPADPVEDNDPHDIAMPADDGLPVDEPTDPTLADVEPDEVEDSPSGFPGGAILVSLGDALAVTGGAVWAGAGGLGALLLAAAMTGAAGLAWSARKNKNGKGRRDGGRTGSSARGSRRAAGMASGGFPGGRGGKSPGRRKSGKGTPGAGGGLFGRGKSPGGKAGKGNPGGSAGRGKSPGRKSRKGSSGSGGGLFGWGWPGSRKNTAGSGGKGKNKNRGKGRSHSTSDPGIPPRTGTKPRGKNSAPDQAKNKPLTPDEAARLAEQARKANQTATDGTAASDVTNEAISDGAAMVAGPEFSGGFPMGQFPLPGAASEFRSAASRYVPDDMFEFGHHLTQMPAAMLDIAEGLKAMTLRAHAERPVDPRVIEALAALYQVQRATIAAAETIAPTFRKVHERDLSRRENPRTNEQEWNV